MFTLVLSQSLSNSFFLILFAFSLCFCLLFLYLDVGLGIMSGDKYIGSHEIVHFLTFQFLV